MIKLPAWERWVTFFLGGMLISGLCGLFLLFLRPFTGTAWTLLVTFGLSGNVGLSCVFAQFSPRNNVAYAFTVVLNLLIVLILCFAVTATSIGLVQRQAFEYAELLVKEIQDYEAKKNIYPDEATLIKEGTVERIGHNWNQRAHWGIRFKHKFHDHPLAAVVGQQAVMIFHDRDKRPTVLITEMGPAPGPFMHWDWDSSDWVVSRGKL